jgi:hypothetical protein
MEDMVVGVVSVVAMRLFGNDDPLQLMVWPCC